MFLPEEYLKIMLQNFNQSETLFEKIIELKEAIVRGGGSIDNQRETPDQIFAVVPINAVYVFFHSNIVQGHVIDSAHRLSKSEVNQVPDFVFPDEV